MANGHTFVDLHHMRTHCIKPHVALDYLQFLETRMLFQLMEAKQLLQHGGALTLPTEMVSVVYHASFCMDKLAPVLVFKAAARQTQH